MNIFEWNENTPVTANNLNEMQNIINDNVIEHYSTDEIKTNKIWIDDKPIYRKVYTNIYAGKSLDFDISELSAEYITDIRYRCYDGINTYDIGNRYNIWQGAEQFNRIFLNSSNTNTLYLRTNNDNSVFMHIIIEYTKTTD